MSSLAYHTSDRDRICKLCEKPIERGERALIMKQVHVPPKRRDLHFHTDCYIEAYWNAE